MNSRNPKVYKRNKFEGLLEFYQTIADFWGSLRENMQNSEEAAPEEKKTTFQRGLPYTVIGFIHVVLGFSTTVWALTRIYLIGYQDVYQFGFFLVFFNYLFETKSLLLWISGIGILRSKQWGKILASIWGGLTILLHLVAQIVRRHYWGDLIPPPGWGEMFLIYYSCIYILCVYGKPLYHLSPRILAMVRERDFSFRWISLPKRQPERSTSALANIIDNKPDVKREE